MSKQIKLHKYMAMAMYEITISFGMTVIAICSTLIDLHLFLFTKHGYQAGQNRTLSVCVDNLIVTIQQIITTML